MALLKIQPFSIDTANTFVFANANITANLNTGNATLGNLATANFFSGNGSLLTSLTGGNVSGQVGNALLAGTVYTNAQPNITSTGTLTGLTVSNGTGTVNFTGTGNVTLGAVANLHISGGTAGYVLSTDGSGALTWINSSSATGNANISGSNTQIFFNDNGSNTLGSSANLTFDKVSNTLTVFKISANGSLLTSITGANVTGEVTFAATANAVAGANVSGAVSYATTANAVAGANVSGQVGNALVAGTVYTASQPNITSVGTLTSLAVTGNITAGNANVTGQLISTIATGTAPLAVTSTTRVANLSVAYANVSDYSVVTTQTTGTFYPVFVSANTTANYALASNSALSYNVATGTLTTGNISAGSGTGGNISGANLITSNYFSGSGNLLSNIQGANVSGAVGLATYATTANAVAGANVSGAVSYATTANAVAGANVSGAVTYATTANAVAGANVSGQVGNALVAGTVYTASQPNITSVGTLSSLTVTGDTTLTGNLTVAGSFEYANVTSFRVKDPIIEQGGNTTGAALGSNDGFDRGQLLHYYSGSTAVDAFMGWDNSNAEFAFASNASIASEVATFNTFGNLRAGYFLGNGSQLTGVSAASSYNIANGTSNVDIVTSGGNVTVGVAGNAAIITVTGTGVNIAGYANLGTGNVIAGNASLGNAVTANYFIGNLYGTANLATYATTANAVAGANVSGAVTYATTANAVAGANVSGAVSYATTANAVAGANVSGAVGLATFATTANAVAGANVSGTVSSATTAGTVTTAAQGNITSLGTLTGLTSGGTVNFTTAGNVTLGAVANLHISGGSANYYLQTDGSGALTWAAVPTTILSVDPFVGDGSWTMKTLSVTPVSINYTIVTIGGVSQPRTAYSLSGAVITFSDPPPNGAIVEITTVTAGAAGGGGGASWTYSAVSANTSAVAGYRYIVDTATANLTITLPASATLGDEIMIIDGTGNASTHEITVARNGGNIQGGASNMTVSTDRAAFTLVYYNATQGWILTNV